MELTKIQALCDLANVELDLKVLNAINGLNLRDDFNNPDPSTDHDEAISSDILNNIEETGRRYESAKSFFFKHESALSKEILRDIEPLLDKLPVLYLSAFTQGSIGFSQQGI